MTEPENRLARLIKPAVHAMSAYHVANAQGLVKLDAMENPYPWPQPLQRQWLDMLREQSVNRYPDPQGEGVKQALRTTMAIPDALDILLGNGSDEIIQMVLMAVQGRHGVLSPTPGFVMYEIIAQCLGMSFHGIPLSTTFTLDETFLAAVQRHQPDVIFIAFPNNPTGNLFDVALIDAVIEAAPGVVVIDEAYAPFTDQSYLPRLLQWEHVLVMRTLSKMGLAGLRLGYLVGRPDWIRAFDKVRLPYNINVLTQQAVTLALANKPVFDQQAQVIRAARAEMYDQLAALGMTVFPSAANFLLFRLANHDAAVRVFTALKCAKVLIKNLSQPNSPLSGCLRVTIGAEQENHLFMRALADCI